MSGWIAAIVSMLAVANPIGVSRAVAWADRQSPDWRRRMAGIVAGSGAALAALGLLTAPMLDLADLSTPTFRLGAAVVMGITGAVWLVRPIGPIVELEASERTTLGVTMLLTPGNVFTAMAANGDAGTAAGLVAVVLAIGAVMALLALPRPPERIGSWSARLTGAATIVIAVAVGIDSARTV